MNELNETQDFREIRKAACLTIAGSDSGGNAGVQADLRAFHCFGVHGCTVLTALTAQNPFGVDAAIAVSPEFVQQQLQAVLEPYTINALKTGMLATAEVAEAVAETLALHPRITKVVDPVMVATSGPPLLEDDAIALVREKLLPAASLMTPNIPEAEILADGSKIDSWDGMVGTAKRLADRYGCAVLLKGGHGTLPAQDALFDGKTLYRISTPIVEDPISTHGTGCSLSAAIAASAACGDSLLDAVIAGKAYVYEAIRTGILVGEAASVMGTPKRIPVEDVRVETF